jgi:hypothetical protein
MPFYILGAYRKFVWKKIGMDFHEIRYWGFVLKSLRQFEVGLKWDKSDKQLK